jgi:hypothetical protein
MEKRAKKEREKGGKRERQRGFTVALSRLFSFPPELHVGPRFFFEFPQLLFEKGGKNRQRNDENGKKGKRKGGVKKAHGNPIAYHTSLTRPQNP